MGSEVKTQEIPKKMRDKKKLLLLLLLLLCAGITVFFWALQKSGADKTEWLLKKLENPSAKTVEINDRIVITKPITVNGEKTITGTGIIIFKSESSQRMKYESYRIPEGECEAFEIADLTQVESMFEVAKGGNLTISGELTLDADNKSMCVNVNESGKLIVSESAVLQNGLGANILSDGEISVTGGSVKADEGYNIVSNGSMIVSDGEIIGSGERMMNIVANGNVSIQGGRIAEAKGTNIYLLGGQLTLSGGTVNGAAIDNVFVKTGSIDVSEGTLSEGSHGVHNMGTATISGGTYENNTSHVYNEGTVTVDKVSFGNSFGSNLVNTGKNAQMKAVGVVIESATSHGVYNVRGAKLDAENLTVKSALAKGIHNGGGYFTGKNVTIIRASGVGVGNDIEKGWTGDSEVTIEGLKILKASYHSLTNANGVMNIKDAELGLISANCIQITGGTLNLEDANIKGTSGTGTFHVIYIQNGIVNAENVVIERSVSRGIQNRGGEFNGKNITISNTGGTAVGNMVSADGVTNGNITIDGLEISGASGYSIQNSGKGTISISNGVVKLTDRTAVRAEDGEIKLSKVEIVGEGTEKEATTKYGGITSVGGKITLKDVKVTNMLARGISLTNGEIVGSDIKINKTGGTGIAVEGGSVKLSNVITQNVKGYNVDVKKGTAEISKSTLNKGTTNSVRLEDGTLSLDEVVVNETPQIKNNKGEMESCHGILALAGKLSLTNVTVQNTTGRGLDNRGASVTGKTIVIKDAGGTAIRSSAGTTKLDGVAVIAAVGYSIQNVEKGKIAIANGTVEINNRTAVQCEEGTIELSNTEIIGVGDAKDAATNYGGITVVGGKVTLKDVKVTNVLARGISLTGGNIVGSGLVVNKTGGTGIAVEGGTLKLSNVTTQDVKGYNLDVQKGTAEIAKSTLNKGTTHSVRLEKGTLTMKDTLVNGTPQESVVGGERKVYIGVSAKAGNLNLSNVTVKDTSGRNISNEGASLNGVNITLEKAQNATSLYNTGSITIDGLSIVNGSSYAIDNHGSMSLTRAKVFDCANRAINNQENASLSLDEYEIRGNNGQAIYNDGEVHLGDGIIDSGANDAITVRKGSVTMDGRIDITTTGYAVKLTDNGKLYMDSDVVFLSNAKIYLPKKSPIKVIGNGIGNTTAQKIELAPTSTEYGTVYVETTSEGVSKDLELANIFIVTTASVVADGKNMVAAELREVEYDEEATTIEVSTWAEIKNAVESAEEGDFLKIVLKNNISLTDEGVIKQGEDDRVKVLLTDEGKGYKITRTNLKNALFTINVGSQMILDGTLILDGASSKEVAASETMLLNKGTLTINKDVTIQNGYKSEKANSLDTSRSTCSAGAIENIGILNLHGTVTTSSSGNGSALSSLGGTLSINGARLNNNIGRALRIVDGEVLIRDTEMNHNGNVSGGGSLLIDDADVTIYDSYFNNNTSTGPGGAIQTTSSDCKLFMKNCEVKENTAATRGGGININAEASQNITLEKCVINNNTSSTDAGGGVYISENSKVQMADCTISQNVCETSGKQGGGIYLNTAELTLDGCTVEKNGVQGAGGGIRIGTKAILTLQGNTKISDNTATSYGTQIWVNAADATINWGSDVLISVTNHNVANDSVGMIGLNQPGVNIVLTGAMKEDNLVTVKAKELVDGNVILSGYNANDPNAEINTWIQAAADNFTIVSPIGLKVGTDGTIEKGQIKVSASSWEELKAVIENEEYKGYDLAVTLKSNITEADDAIIVDGVTITLTDNESEYTITRTNKTKTMFDIKNGSALILDGKLTLDGNSSNSQKAAEAMILNRGTLTINSNVIIKNGYKEAAKTSLDATKTSLSGGAIESIGTLNVYGTITASGSGNNSAISVLDGTFIATGAKLNSNQGRAARIVKGNTTFTNVEINNNIASDSGAGLLIDYATVVISGGSISSNKATGNGGAIVVQSTASLQMSDCIVNDNQATVNGGAFSITTSSETVVFTNCKIGVDGENKAGNKASEQGGAFYIKGDCTVTLNGCTVANNESVKRGGAVRIDKGTLNANNSNFNSNYGKQSGGAFFIYEVAEVELTSCNMSGNKSDGNGKTVHIWKADAELTLIGCTINDVASANAGTAEIYKQESPTVTHQ